MKTYYIIKMPKGRPAIADVDHTSPHRATITRINVPLGSRGQNYGSRLLRMITQDADHQRVTLELVINPSPYSFTYHQLEEWYERHGFKPSRHREGVYVRKPGPIHKPPRKPSARANSIQRYHDGPPRRDVLGYGGGGWG